MSNRTRLIALCTSICVFLAVLTPAADARPSSKQQKAAVEEVIPAEYRTADVPIPAEYVLDDGRGGDRSVIDNGGGAMPIIGGDDVLPGTYPFMVSLQKTHTRTFPAAPGVWEWSDWLETPAADEQDGHLCGATLISAQWLVTAAHCMNITYNAGFGFMVTREYKVDALIGPTVLTQDGPLVERIAVSEVHLNPNWSGGFGDLSGDIALLKLETPTSTAPVRLRSVSSEADLLAMMIGWGRTDPEVAVAEDHLQQATVNMVAPTNCTGTPNILCFENVDGEPHQGACKGDSGGPTMLWNASATRWEQIGVISFVDGGDVICDDFTATTRIGSFANWIRCTAGVTVFTGGPVVAEYLCAEEMLQLEAVD